MYYVDTLPQYAVARFNLPTSHCRVVHQREQGSHACECIHMLWGIGDVQLESRSKSRYRCLLALRHSYTGLFIFWNKITILDIDLVVVVVVVVFVIIADIYTLIFIDHAAGNIYLQLGFAVIYWTYKIKKIYTIGSKDYNR